jgi:replication factor C small subunit/replication factor C subunit 2/4
LILRFAPDWRRVINECQRHSISGVLNNDVLLGSSNANVKELTSFLKSKDFKKMRAWVVNNMDQDTVSIFRGIYDNMNEYVEPHSIPQLVLILADYQYKAAFVADHELNVVACMTEIMANVSFK